MRQAVAVGVMATGALLTVLRETAAATEGMATDALAGMRQAVAGEGKATGAVMTLDKTE